MHFDEEQEADDRSMRLSEVMQRADASVADARHLAVHGRHHLAVELGGKAPAPLVTVLVYQPMHLMADAALYLVGIHDKTPTHGFMCIAWLESRLPKARRARRRRAKNIYELLLRDRYPDEDEMLGLTPTHEKEKEADQSQ